MIAKNKVSRVVFCVSLLAFMSFAVYILGVNQEVLYTAHNRSEFIYGSPFFNTLMSKPFGLVQYIGAWLTQFFYYPALGSGILLALWTLIFCVGKKAFGLKGSASALMLLPVACLLTSLVDLGYWVYVNPIRGYWFSQSIGYLAMLLLLWIANCTPHKWHFIFYLLGFCLFPVLGWFALLFVLCLAFSRKPSWRELLAVAVVLLSAVVWRYMAYSGAKFENILLAGFPYFECPSDSTPHLSVPFVLLGVVGILISLCGRFLAKWYVPVLSTVAGIVLTMSLMYTDKNYIDEMRMSRAAESDDWNMVMSIYEKVEKPTTSMIMLKNISLMNSGSLLDKAFKLGNDGTAIYNPDSIHVSFLQIAAPMSCYNYGLINESSRLAFECSELAGFSPYYLKLLSRCALANGEQKLLQRYTTILRHHPFYSQWQPSPVSANVKELKGAYKDELAGTENSYNFIVNSLCLWCDTQSKLGSEQALFYSMIRNDAPSFWTALRRYIESHQGEEFPLHAQEAYILYIDKAPEEKKMQLPISEDVYDRYMQFWDTLTNYMKTKVKSEIPDAMRKDYGDTFWYFYIFGRKIY